MLYLHSWTLPTLFSRDRVFFLFISIIPVRSSPQKRFCLIELNKLFYNFFVGFHLWRSSSTYCKQAKKHSLCKHFMTCGLRRLQAIVCIAETVKVRRQWFVQIQDCSTSVSAANHRELLAVMRANILRFVRSCWHCKAFSTHCTNNILNRTV